MLTTIEIKCPRCHSPNITRNGKKNKGKQHYRCKDCGRQFKSGRERTYNGTLSRVKNMIKIMPVRGAGVRDIVIILEISNTTVFKVLTSTKYRIKQNHYDRLEIDEFWTYAGEKKNNVWLIYTYHRESGEIAAFVWGKRDLKTAKKLRKRIKRLGISYDRIATDDWDSFLSAFAEDQHEHGKAYTVGIEGNNCRLRIRRAFRRTCCFSKKLFNHLKAFDMPFFYINYGFI
ncbi:MAG: IS1 family transposase [Treponema sp.]|jgi:IS1 family transposase/transposase-like protein|nr:IS1 family transposase [Treponema sp.]